MKMKRDGFFRRYGWLLHIPAILPLLWLLLEYYTGRLTANPVQTAMQRSGDFALLFLLLTLACTPLAFFSGWRWPVRLRRPLGLYTFLYALAHFLMFAWADFGWQMQFILPEISQKRYLWAGLCAFLLLLILALLSWRPLAALSGRYWKALQRLVYPAALLALLHLAWVVKGDLLRLSGDIWKPLAAGLTLALLLLARLPLAFYTRRRGRLPLDDGPV